MAVKNENFKSTYQDLRRQNARRCEVRYGLIFLFKHYFALIHLPQELKAHRGGSCKHKLQYYITITTRSTDKRGSVQTNKYRQTSTSTTSTDKQVQTKKDRLGIA